MCLTHKLLYTHSGDSSPVEAQSPSAKVLDRLGHLTGNRLLQSISDALKASCRDTDYIARLGGDEFVVTVPRLSSGELDILVQRLQRAVNAVGIMLCGESTLSASIGHASLSKDGTEAEKLLARADQRMYEAKRANASRPVPYSDSDPSLKVLINY